MLTGISDSVLTGSNNKIAYEVAARRHVRSAMDGFNAVIFAYGQTASGKTFTLVWPISYVYILFADRWSPTRVALTKNLELYREQ
jgi:hypothetical protein